MKLNPSTFKDSDIVNFLEACVVGLVAAGAAYGLTIGVSWLGTARVRLSDTYAPEIVLPILGLLGGIVCGVIVQWVAPEISGSGIPQVKGIIAGAKYRLDMRVLVCKLVGGIYALGCGMPLGREGPTVQIGSAAAGILDNMGLVPRAKKKQLIAAGAGAGLAAAFNAPLAGVVFVIEELLKDVSGPTVSAAALACFCAASLSSILSAHSLDVKAQVMFPGSDFHLRDIPFLILLGVIAGVMGSLFNAAIMKLCTKSKQLGRNTAIIRIALAGLVCGLVVGFLPEPFHNVAGMKHLIIMNHPSWHFAIIAFATNFVLTAVAYGSGAPGGLFGPSLTIGGAMGYLVGMLEMTVIPGRSNAEALLGLAGMGAFFSAVARVPITATVIVFEITQDFNLLLPLLISSMVAYIVGEKLSRGSIYDRLLEMDEKQTTDDGQPTPETKPTKTVEPKTQADSQINPEAIGPLAGQSDASQSDAQSTAQ